MTAALRMDSLKVWQLDVLAVVVIIVGILAVYFLEMAPSLARHDAVIAKQHELEMRKTHKQEVEDSLQRMHQRMATSEAFISKSGVSLESLNRMNDRIALLEDMASSAGLQVEGFEHSKPESSNCLTATDIRLAAKGTYPDVLRFLTTVHAKSPDSVVVSFELVAAPSTKEPVAAVIMHLAWQATPEKVTASK